VAHLFVLVYLSAWALESVALVAVSHWLRDSSFRALRSLAISVVADAAWPLLTLGVLQYCAVVVVSKFLSDREARLAQCGAAPDPAQQDERQQRDEQGGDSDPRLSGSRRRCLRPAQSADSGYRRPRDRTHPGAVSR
jgi:hypothetical protein